MFECWGTTWRVSGPLASVQLSTKRLKPGFVSVGAGNVEGVGGERDFDEFVASGFDDEEELLDVEAGMFSVPVPIPLTYPLLPQAVAVSTADFWLASSVDGASARRASSKLSWALYQAVGKAKSLLRESVTTDPDPVVVEAVDPVVAVPERFVTNTVTLWFWERSTLFPMSDIEPSESMRLPELSCSAPIAK